MTTTNTYLDSAALARELSGIYNFDPENSRIAFEARHAVVTKVHGAFHDFSGTARLDGANPAASKIDLSINVGSISTGNNKRDDHLRTNDFFDVAKYPTITFTSTQVMRVKPTVYALTGNLTIKDVTSPVTVEFTFHGALTDPWGNHCAGFEGRLEVNRKDWNVSFHHPLETGGVMVSDHVTLIFDISAVKRMEHPGSAHHTGRPIEGVEDDLVVPVIPGISHTWP